MFNINGGPLRGVVRRALISRRRYGDDACEDCGKREGLVLGAYDGCDPGSFKLTPAAVKFDAEVHGRLSELMKGRIVKKGKVHILSNLGCPNFYAVAVTGVGKDGLGFNQCEVLQECKENIRKASAAGVLSLERMGVRDICVEDFTNSEASAEGAALSIYRYQGFLKKKQRKKKTCIGVYNHVDVAGWERGLKFAMGQNTARKLEEIPANIMTPRNFGAHAVKILCPLGVQVDVRDMKWLEDKHWHSFLMIGKGSCEPPAMVELNYCGGNQDDKPVVFVGKGVTFDSGGVCLKPLPSMLKPKCDIAGAAVIVGLFETVARLALPINITALIPMAEYMPGGSALKPGDVVYSLNKKTVRLQDTAKEGRVLLTDALTYSTNYKPCLLCSIANVTSGMPTALGTAASGLYTNSDIVWKEMKMAGAETGDRVWRMPLWHHFVNLVTRLNAVDVNNVGSDTGGDPCTAAAFLTEFTPPGDFMHIDLTGTGATGNGYGFPYLHPRKVTGRPTRTIVQFLQQLSCPAERPSQCGGC